jgi:nucleoside phosphorylase
MSSYEEIELTLLQEKYDIDFLIVIATDIELEKSLEQLLPWQDKIIKTYSGSNTFYCGLYGLYTCAIVKTNQMGAVLSGAALQTTSESIDAIKPKAVIMGGIALGKSSEKQKLGDILVSKSIILYEQARVNEGGEVDYRGPKPESSRFLLNRLIQHTTHNYSFDNVEKVAKVLSGPILTGEKLIDDSEFKNVLFKQFPDAIGGEMEAAGVYAACNAKNIPWIIVKSICDWADGNKNKNFQAESAQVVFSFIHRALNSPIAFKDINITPFTIKNDSPANDLIELEIEISDEQLITFLAEEYSDVVSARSLWKRAGGKNGDVSNISRPRDMWQSIWQMAVNGALVTPVALLNEIGKDYPNNKLIHGYLNQLLTKIQ